MTTTKNVKIASITILGIILISFVSLYASGEISDINTYVKQNDSKNVLPKNGSEPGNSDPSLLVISRAFSSKNLLLTLFIFVIGCLLVWQGNLQGGRMSERILNGRSAKIRSYFPVISVAVWLMMLYIAVKIIFKLSNGVLLTLLASIGVAIGLASQDILKDWLGGIVILFSRPFYVGDKIQIGAYYGTVDQIGLRSTQITTPDDSKVTIPNASFIQQAVSSSNFGELFCQVVAEIYLPIAVDTNSVRMIAMESAKQSQYITARNDKPIIVEFLNEVKERRSYLKMRLKAYVGDAEDEFIFKSDMIEKCLAELLVQKIILQEQLF